MKTRIAILFAIVSAFVAASPASAVPANPIDATAVTLLPADGTKESLRKMAASFSATIAKANTDANTKRNQLRKHLIEGFDRAVTQAQTAGDLDTVLALKNAKEQFDTLDDSEIPLVKNAIVFREKKTAEIEATRISDALKAAKDFNDELEKAKIAETQKGKIEEAKAFSDHQKKVQEWAKSLQKDIKSVSPQTMTTVPPVNPRRLPGLSVRYYDDSPLSKSNWLLSEQECRNHFRQMTPSIQSTSESFGSSLSSGLSYETSSWRNDLQQAATRAGLSQPVWGVCRLHERYGQISASNFSVLMTGKLMIQTRGSHEFAALADDGAVLFIDGQKVLDAKYDIIGKGASFLNVGEHTIVIVFYERTGAQGFTVQWKQPGASSYVPIPQSVLFHGEND